MVSMFYIFLQETHIYYFLYLYVNNSNDNKFILPFQNPQGMNASFTFFTKLSTVTPRLMSDPANKFFG